MAKNKTVFPNDDALRKTLYLTTRDITQKWTMPYRDWGETYGQFAIEFGDRAANAYACVAYRIMNYDAREQSEEHLDLLFGLLADFYTEQEIQKIYQQDIVFDSFEAVMNDKEIKQKIE